MLLVVALPECNIICIMKEPFILVDTLTVDATL
jgi:hypothetical protein